MDAAVIMKRLRFKAALIAFVAQATQEGLDEDFAIRVLEAIEPLNEAE